MSTQQALSRLSNGATDAPAKRARLLRDAQFIRFFYYEGSVFEVSEDQQAVNAMKGECNIRLIDARGARLIVPTNAVRILE
jgi:hypothetical protein